MADKSKIEWTDATWNPIRARNKATGKVGWHCEHATTGCQFCYAENFNQRLGTGLPFKPGHRDDIKLFLDEQILKQPLRWKRPRKIFVGSMTDVFADFIPDAWLDRMFAVMALSPEHTFQVLTKRAERMRRYFLDDLPRHAGVARTHAIDQAIDLIAPSVPAVSTDVSWPLPNVWLGVSAERQEQVEDRIPLLLQTPAAVHFISAEPLLGPIDLMWPTYPDEGGYAMVGFLRDRGMPDEFRYRAAKLDWVIAGGESGSQARPMHLDWVRGLRDQCAAAGTAFFFKQWGEWLSGDDNAVFRIGKKRAGRVLDGKTHSEFPTARSATQ